MGMVLGSEPARRRDTHAGTTCRVPQASRTALNLFCAMLQGSFDPLSNMLVLACLLAAKEKKPLQCGAYLGTAIYLRFVLLPLHVQRSGQ